ncbi:hypothetical protein SKAU_G00048560 [Synaphobranchus kaupii]|uniref:Calcium-activated potassium channel subunit beta-2 n=1 Tax=Synaphobranchus kaupii TaxID=118154 RepID=A0A9Q1G2Z4_SYNKA|nr:hypothetical protein SKAU_G00048560 [Synaphobranchus kaupii]
MLLWRRNATEAPSISPARARLRSQSQPRNTCVARRRSIRANQRRDSEGGFKHCSLAANCSIVGRDQWLTQDEGSFQYPPRSTSVSRRRGGAPGRMFLWAGSKGTQASGHERRTIYQKIREYDILDKRKTVTALKAGEDRAILLGLAMILCAVMMYFVLGITKLRSYSDRTCGAYMCEESSCTVLNSSITSEMNCSYSCGSDCRRSSSYPCLQVFVSLNTSGKITRLSHNEEAQDRSPECFYVPKCRRDSVAMHSIVLNVSDWLKAQQRLPCFYDPSERQDTVLLTRLYGRGGRVPVSGLAHLYPRRGHAHHRHGEAHAVPVHSLRTDRQDQETDFEMEFGSGPVGLMCSRY